MKIGVIAENKSDVDVLYELTCKLINENTFSFKKFVGQGCGKLRRKCAKWAEHLFKQGCSYLVIVHDLDRHNESELRRKLAGAVINTNYDAHLILIPTREIEAWLLTDANALQEVFKLSKVPKLPGQPESLIDPKKELEDLIRKSEKKVYVNTAHNKKIAAAMSIEKAKMCKSFCPYPTFVSEHLDN